MPMQTLAFKDWLSKARATNDPAGDWIRDSKSPYVWKRFPDHITSLHQLIAFMRTVGRPCAEAIAAAAEVWDRFQGKPTTRTPLSPKMRFRVFRRDSYRCRLCGATTDDGIRLEVDHIVAVAKGGTNAESNLWTLCRPCNAGKGAEDLS